MPPADQIAVIGCGYVGLVTAVGLAEQGMRVRAYDVDPARVAACRALEFPMVEPGLEEAARAAGVRLTFHDTGEDPWPDAAFTFVAVPTPQGEAGYPNLSMLRQALAWIAAGPRRATRSSVIVIRSTVPPGTVAWVQDGGRAAVRRSRARRRESRVPPGGPRPPGLPRAIPDPDRLRGPRGGGSDSVTSCPSRPRPWC